MISRFFNLDFKLFTAAFVCVLFLSNSTYSISAAGFDAGRIIDNQIFEKNDTMSKDEIQLFLDNQIQAQGGCDNPTCLYNYYEDPDNPSRNNYNGGSIPSGGKSAAQYIYEAAQEAKINPQVLLVTLQKETSLITHTFPGFWRFERAMGYGCFDTTGCKSTYAGFSKQVRLAALQYRKYLTYPNNYNYPPGHRNVRFNPADIFKSQNEPSTWTCKGPNPVYIQNTATAGLYAYTPYQPNQTALDSYPGTGNSCSSYGNRNFWFKFTEWFGSTKGTPFFRLGNTARVYILGSENNYYYIPSYELLEAYGYPDHIQEIDTVGIDYIDGLTLSGRLPRVARFEGGHIYLIDRGKRRHFPTRTLYEDVFGYVIGEEAKLPTTTSYYYPQYSDMRSVLDEHDGPGIHFVENAQRRHIVDMNAYNSGTPPYSSLPVVHVSLNYIKTLKPGLPVIAPNTYIKDTASNYYFWNGETMYKFSGGLFSELGLIHNYLLPESMVSGIAGGSYSQVNALVKNSSGQLYILDRNKRFSISDDTLSKLGLSSEDFTEAPDILLDDITVKVFPDIFRVNKSAAIYKVDFGEIKQYLNEKALSEQGYSAKHAKDINLNTFKLLNNRSALVLPKNLLFRIDNSSKVYMTNTNNSSVLIPGRQFLDNARLSLKDVVSLSSANVADYPRVLSLRYYVKKPSGQVWFINNQIRHYVSGDIASTNKFNLDTGAIPEFSHNFVTSFKSEDNLTELLRSSTGSKVYKIENGLKRWVTSESTLYSLGYSHSDVTVVTPGFVSSIPDGANIN